MKIKHYKHTIIRVSYNYWHKSDACFYAHVTKPHAITRYVDNISSYPPCKPLAYTPFNKVLYISEEPNEMYFTYGHDRLRRKTQLYDNSVLQQTKLFLGNYEKVKDETTGTEKEYHYLSSPSGLFAVVTKTEGGSEELNYVLTDHLGSIQTITDDEGELPTTYCYGPWGRLRNASTWDYFNPCSLPFFGGYTGHEHLEEFGLINMFSEDLGFVSDSETKPIAELIPPFAGNGRLYDPVLGRMLSPDNFVQNSSNSQTYNRYTYAYNNPLKFNDPDGEHPILIAMAIGAVMGGYSGYQIGKARGESGAGLIGYIMMGAGIGGIAGGVGASAGLSVAASSGSIIGGAAGGAAGGIVNGFYTGALASANPYESAWKGSLSGMVGGGVGSSIGGPWGAVLGGASGSVTNSILHKQAGNEVVNAAITGGLLGWASWEATNFMQYRAFKNSSSNTQGIIYGEGEGNQIALESWKYNQYRKANIAIQKSFTRNVEAGFWLTKKGTSAIVYGTKNTLELDWSFYATHKKDIVGVFHTHVDRSGFSQNYAGYYGDDLVKMDINSRYMYLANKQNTYIWSGSYKFTPPPAGNTLNHMYPYMNSIFYSKY